MCVRVPQNPQKFWERVTWSDETGERDSTPGIRIVLAQAQHLNADMEAPGGLLLALDVGFG